MDEVPRRDLERRLEARLGAGKAALGPADLPGKILDVAGDVRANRVLDVGCGTGELCRLLSERGAFVTGVDLCSNLLARARREAPRSFCSADAERLPFQKAGFDLATSLLLLHYLPDPRRALFEIARVLVPGGRLLLCDRIASADPGLRQEQDELERLRNPQLRRLLPAAEIAEALRDAGFRVSWEADGQTRVPLDRWLGGAGSEEARERASRLAGRDLGGLRITPTLDVELRMRLFVARTADVSENARRAAS